MSVFWAGRLLSAFQEVETGTYWVQRLEYFSGQTDQLMKPFLKMTDTLVLPASPQITEKLGHYQLVREAGRGGMSIVYEAIDLRDGRQAALKLLYVPPGLADDQQEAMLGRFMREARAVASIKHPHIVSIYELGEEQGRHYLVMEYLKGETLQERLSHGPLTPAQALPILSQIAQALDAVHAQDVVHRDIKPSNIMLLPDGTAKLLDFGVARQSDDSTITSTGALVGSPAYMSPEQVRGAEGTAASDIWALGALLYEMLAGHPPFTGKSIPAVLYQVTHEAPKPIVGISSPVQRVLRRALDKNPARRFATAVALSDALRAASPEYQNQPRGRLPLWPLAAILVPVLLGVWIVMGTRHKAPPPVVSQPLLTAPVPPAASPPLLHTTHFHRPLPTHPHQSPRMIARRLHKQKLAQLHLRHLQLAARRKEDRDDFVRHPVWRRAVPERRFRRYYISRPRYRGYFQRRLQQPESGSQQHLEHFIWSPDSP